jgi:hypothetical protein
LTVIQGWVENPAQNPHVIVEVPIESDGDSLTVTLNVDQTPILATLDFGLQGLRLDASAVPCRFVDRAPLIVRDFTGAERELRLIQSPKVLKLGNAVLRDGISFAMPMEDFRWLTGRRIQGIIGLEAFQDYFVEFDWESKKMRLRDNIPSGFKEWVPIRRKPKRAGLFLDGSISLVRDGLPQPAVNPLKTELDRLKSDFETPETSHEILFQLESGVCSLTDILLIDGDFDALNDYGVLNHHQNLFDKTLTPSKHERVLRNLSIGTCRDQNLDVSVMSALSSSMLTTWWMLRHPMLFDIKQQRLYLAQRKSPLVFTARGRLTGLTIDWNEDWTKEPVIKVLDVRDDSIASRAGLQIDDRIIQFNGQRLESFRPHEIRVAQYQASSRHTLRIRRGQQEFNVELRIP